MKKFIALFLILSSSLSMAIDKSIDMTASKGEYSLMNIWIDGAKYLSQDVDVTSSLGQPNVLFLGMDFQSNSFNGMIIDVTSQNGWKLLRAGEDKDLSEAHESITYEYGLEYDRAALGDHLPGEVTTGWTGEDTVATANRTADSQINTNFPTGVVSEGEKFDNQNANMISVDTAAIDLTIDLSHADPAYLRAREEGEYSDTITFSITAK
jgi:hypothetical protein